MSVWHGDGYEKLFQKHGFYVRAPREAGREGGEVGVRLPAGSCSLWAPPNPNDTSLPSLFTQIHGCVDGYSRKIMWLRVSLQRGGGRGG